MPTVEVERHFAAPIEEVWKVYTDHAGWNRWAGFSTSRLDVEGKSDPNGTGAVRAFGSAGAIAYEEILEFDAPKRMTYRVLRGGPPMKNHLGEAVLTPEAGGTRLVWRCRFESKIPGLGGPLKFFLTRFLSKALAGLEKNFFPNRPA